MPQMVLGSEGSRRHQRVSDRSIAVLPLRSQSDTPIGKGHGNQRHRVDWRRRCPRPCHRRHLCGNLSVPAQSAPVLGEPRLHRPPSIASERWDNDKDAKRQNDDAQDHKFELESASEVHWTHHLGDFSDTQLSQLLTAPAAMLSSMSRESRHKQRATPRLPTAGTPLSSPPACGCRRGPRARATGRRGARRGAPAFRQEPRRSA